MVFYVFLVIQPLHVDTGTNLVTFLEVDHILDSTALGLFVALRQVIYLLPVQTSHLGEEHHRRVHRCLINFLNEILVTCATRLRANTATALLTEISQRRTFDITEVRDCNHHLVICIHILRVELSSHLHDLRLTLVAVFILDLDKFGIDQVITHFF